MSTPSDLRLNPLAINNPADGTSGEAITWMNLTAKSFDIMMSRPATVQTNLAVYDDEEMDVETSGAGKELDPRDRMPDWELLPIKRMTVGGAEFFESDVEGFYYGTRHTEGFSMWMLDPFTSASAESDVVVETLVWQWRMNTDVKRIEYNAPGWGIYGFIVNLSMLDVPASLQDGVDGLLRLRSGDVEENPGPDPQQKEDRNVKRERDLNRVKRSSRKDRHPGKKKPVRDNDLWLVVPSRQEIKTLLIRGGVEENPGPVFEADLGAGTAEEAVCDNAGKTFPENDRNVVHGAGGFRRCRLCNEVLEKVKRPRKTMYRHPCSSDVLDFLPRSGLSIRRSVRMSGSDIDVDQASLTSETTQFASPPSSPSAPPVPSTPAPSPMAQSPPPRCPSTLPPPPPQYNSRGYRIPECYKHEAPLPPPLDRPAEILTVKHAQDVGVPPTDADDTLRPGRLASALPVDPNYKQAVRSSPFILSGRLITQKECADRENPLVPNWRVTKIAQIPVHYQGETRPAPHRNVEILKQDFILQIIELETARSQLWMRLVVAAVYALLFCMAHNGLISFIISSFSIDAFYGIPVAFAAVMLLTERMLDHLVTVAGQDRGYVKYIIGISVSFSIPGYELLKRVLSYADEALLLAALLILMFGRRFYKDRNDFVASICFLSGAGSATYLFPAVGNSVAYWGWKYLYYTLTMCFIGLLYKMRSRQLLYCPHMATSVMSEFHRGADPDRKEIRQKLMRLACMPIPDEMCAAIYDGTEELVASLLRQDFQSPPRLYLAGPTEDAPIE
jgi:hypothetical protein